MKFIKWYFNKIKKHPVSFIIPFIIGAILGNRLWSMI